MSDDRQFFKSQIGMHEPWATARQTPLSHSFCQWVVAGNEDVVVSDAREHPARNNLAISELGVVAYAGMPIFGDSDQPLGSFCAIDLKPREWSDGELATLLELSNVANAYVATAAGLPSAHEAAKTGLMSCATVLVRDTERVGENQRVELVRIVDQLSRQLTQSDGTAQ